ncbi:MAG: FAD-dependent oxidoreductase [Lachnospiraceae bacterium]|nr:FAD-dependent oxidoreductase [Lachnospiraceae bacterium]
MPREEQLIRISFTEKDLFDIDRLKAVTAKKLGIEINMLKSAELKKMSLDARKKDDIRYVFGVDIEVPNEDRFLKRCRIKNAVKVKEVKYFDPISSTGPNIEKLSEKGSYRPVIVGFGPAGLICAYKLAAAGLKPIVLERGRDVENRLKDVEEFFKTGKLCPESNIQFGEGGAGTFSDGKLNTMIHDGFGRIGHVFDIFVRFGADPSIRYKNKPHIGTDVLTVIVKAVREKIIELGGEVRFNSCFTGFEEEDGKIRAAIVNEKDRIECDTIVLAIGHSARDTVRMLGSRGVRLERKAFAMGVRIEHPQELISREMYGKDYKKYPPADYKLTYITSEGRGVYSFCMCPGGVVVNASSQDGRLCVNGMSYSKRDENTANSAIVVEIRESDLEGEDIFAGVRFQEELEKKAFDACNGKIPVCYASDFLNGRGTEKIDRRKPNTKGDFAPCDMYEILPELISAPIKEALPKFDKTIKGFAGDTAIMMAVESRTSSPVRIVREKESMCAEGIEGLYPCGEGAGYAGGITSAAVDGLKVYETIIKKRLNNE